MPSYGGGPSAAGPAATPPSAGPAATPPPTAAHVTPAQRRAHALLAALVGGLAVAGWASSSRDLAATLSVKPYITPVYHAEHLAVSYGALRASVRQTLQPPAGCPQSRSASPQVLAQPPTICRAGKHPSQVLNLWEAEGEGPRPLIVEIHGGGWRQLDYRDLHGGGWIQLGISYASIEFRRLCGDPAVHEGRTAEGRAQLQDCGPLPAPVLDAARALQFIKSKTKEWNIDPDRIILKGKSAGGCSALWLNYHKDLADPASADPVARQSTKVLATIAISAQSTIDPKTIISWGMGPQVLQHPMLQYAVGVISKGENGLRLSAM